MDIVVEGQCLPVHSAVVSQSEVLRCALRDTQNEGRIQLKAPFEDTRVSVVDDFLSQVYVSGGTPFPDDLGRSRDVIELAMRLGMDGILHLGVDNLNKGGNLQKFRDHFLKMNEDPEFVCWWINIVQNAPKSAAYTAIATDLVIKYNSIALYQKGSEWEVRLKKVLSNEMLYKMLAVANSRRAFL